MPEKNMNPPPSTPDTASLLRRLAGSSVNKAGLAKDQTEINRIIAEASKGSKFYEHEKRKDKDLTERINHILKLRDEAVKGVDLTKVEQGVDKLIAQLEAKRDLSQFIVHVDMDAFFASVEVLHDPSLASKAFAVGGGVVSTASYEARKFGVRSGMATFVAKKLCPELIVLKSHYEWYNEMSNKVMSIFRRYDPTMCAAGCDEGYLNITNYCEEHSLSPEECVSQMRSVVQEETMLTVSAGIAPNKNKPNGQFKLDFDPDAVKKFMYDLSIRKVPGVGRVHERLLDSIGVKTCGDVYEHRAVLFLLDKHFGLEFLLQAYLGIASNVVQPGQREERKSIGAERTFNALSDTAKIYAKLEEVAAELEADMEESGWTGKTITLKYKLDTFQVFTRAKSFDRWISTKKEDLFAIGQELLKPELPLTLRLIGLRVTKLKDLKAEVESKARGIKRFFEAAPSSPKKRRRIDASHVEEEDEMPRLSQDGFAITMPGFDDDTEGDTLVHPDGLTADVEAAEHLPARARSLSLKPKSTSVPPARRSPSLKPSSSKATHAPSSSSRRSPTPSEEHDGDQAPPSFLECPICGRMLETDNQGLNEHVDFCLSKQAIKEAQTASLTPSSSGHTSAQGKKPSRKPQSPRRRIT
ncbi:DNA/RNA polymerase [Trametes versicolor FP-101664 SS1]|uniref:DNA/RNA polymerase n=1 Tax=Trametes versicolor (strain FP-101664) TaxID=717944 RepID=UPI0004621485|nr:DNA/RNA polymerase [Trametes versicolor FP-101664 SS1]EIW63572.1 DNA/RNA polymerase [Trametes versicolor FP-101664 SS1]